jgi:hypothetical protein
MIMYIMTYLVQLFEVLQTSPFFIKLYRTLFLKKQLHIEAWDERIRFLYYISEEKNNSSNSLDEFVFKETLTNTPLVFKFSWQLSWKSYSLLLIPAQHNDTN